MTDAEKELLLKYAESCTETRIDRTVTDWHSVSEGMQEEGYTRTPEQWRTQYRLATGKSHSARSATREAAQDESLLEKILTEVKKGTTIKQLSVKTGLSERIVHAALEDLKDKGYLLVDEGDRISLCKDVVPQENRFDAKWNGERVIRFGVVSDNHLGSKCQQLTFLHHLYDIFADEGIDSVYNGGDITDGEHMHPGHQYELFLHGADEQSDYVIEHYPRRDGIRTFFILGNHDTSHVKNGGHDIGKPIAAARPDMVYLGQLNAKVKLTDNCTVEINHPLDGASYALSYTLQKTIDAMAGGEKPNILINGHHHKAMTLFYRNIHAVEAGTTCAQTPWMRGKRLAAMVGGLDY